MKTKIKFLTIIIIFPFLKIFSQSNQIDPIVDTCANYSNNVSYNVGEVFVVFTIQNNPIVSKEMNEEMNEEIEDIPEDAINKSIFISPNPVTNIVTITPSDKTEINKIMLFSMDGKMVMEREIENNQIDLTDLPIGSYILKTDYSESNFKLIKR